MSTISQISPNEHVGGDKDHFGPRAARDWRVRLFATVVLAVITCGPGQAQQVVPDNISCSSCIIRALPIVEIGDAEGPGQLETAASHVVVDSAGRFLLYAGGLPQVFDKNGGFIARIGRRGRGPGEFAGPAYPIPVAHDSILVIEPGRAQASLFDNSLRFVRQIGLPGMMTASINVLSWPDSVVLTGQIHTPERFGFTLHLASLRESSARVYRSGGNEEQFPEEKLYILSVPQHRPFWGVRLGEYSLEKWSRELSRETLLIRKPHWWSTSYEPMGTPTSPPTTIVQRVLVDSAGLLWVFIRVAAPTWKRAWPEKRQQEVPARLIDYAALFETIVEVIDPQAKRVVVRTRLNAPIFAVLPGPHAVAFTPAADGTPRIRILRLNMTESRRR